MKEMKLFAAGPVNVPDSVRKLKYDVIGHREEEFSILLERITKKLLTLFKANDEDYTIVFINGSATASMEAVVSLADSSSYVLVPANGFFGERFVEIYKTYDCYLYPYPSVWNTPINASKVEQILRDSDINFLAMVHLETSTGILNPITEIGQLCRKYRKTFIVDAVSSLGGEEVDVVRDNIDFAIGCENKCIGGLPTLSFICIKNTTMEKFRYRKSRTYYLDLIKHYDYMKTRKQTPYTPQIPLYCYLDKALDELFDEGIQNRMKRFQANTALLRRLLEDAGFEFLVPKEIMGHYITNVKLPSSINFSDVHDRMKKKGYVLYPTRPKAGYGINIGTIGTLTVSDVEDFCQNLIEVVGECKKQ